MSRSFQPIRGEWPWLALWTWLPLAKLSGLFILPDQMLYAGFALFYGGSLFLLVVLLRQRADWRHARSLFNNPVPGLLAGFFCFAVLAGVATALHTSVKFGIADVHVDRWLANIVLALTEPLDVLSRWERLGWTHLAGTAPYMGLAGVGGGLEEFIFRVGLFWRWLRPPPSHPATVQETAIVGLPPWPEVIMKMLVVNVFFALLHWPQPWTALAVAFLGGLAVTIMLLRWRNIWMIATLHLLYNSLNAL